MGGGDGQLKPMEEGNLHRLNPQVQENKQDPSFRRIPTTGQKKLTDLRDISAKTNVRVDPLY